MKISQEDAILIKNLSVKAICCTKPVKWIVRQGLDTWKHRQSAEENPQDGYNFWQPCSGRPRSSHSTGVPCAYAVRRTSRKGIDQLVSFRIKLPSPFKCAQDNSLWSPGSSSMLQTMSCSAVVWSQSHLSSHSLETTLPSALIMLLLSSKP